MFFLREVFRSFCPLCFYPLALSEQRPKVLIVLDTHCRRSSACPRRLGAGMTATLTHQPLPEIWHNISSGASRGSLHGGASFKVEKGHLAAWKSENSRRLWLSEIPCWKIRERPPGLINHVLTVLVFRSWVLVTPHLPSFIQEPQSVPLA